MKSRNKISALWMMCLIVTSSLIFNACNEEEDLDTNQMGSSEVTLKSFGPSPAMRGGELRFIGTNLDKVTSIDLPGVEGITDITAVNKFEIRITIPQTAEPGYLTINSPEGKVESITPISYSEPISISDFSPKSAKAGATITIEGDYLNTVQEVIFADGVHVLKADFVSQNRETLQVKVPIEAQTGKIIVSDGADLLSEGVNIPAWIYTKEDLTVTLPVASKLTPNPLKAGEILIITGTDFDLVSKIILPGGTEIEVKDATTTIEIAETPNDIKVGVVTLIAKSGVEVLSSELKLVIPTISGVSETTVKNGNSFTISGSDLDLVSEIVFQGATVSSADFTSASAAEIILNLPATVTDGIFTLKTLSETETEGNSLTCVVPTVSNVAPLAVKAKETITITGTDLDLVEKAMFGLVEGTIESTTETELTIAVPVGAATGFVTLNTVNGTEVITTQEITINVTLPVITSITGSGPGNIITVEGTDLNLIKTIYLADTDGIYTVAVTDYGTKSDIYLEFYHVLGSATGDITPLMLTVDGDEGYMPSVYCGATDPITDATLMISNFDGDGASQSTWGGVVTFGNPSIDLNGTACMLGLTGSGWQWTWAHNWDYRPALTNPENYVLKFDICITQAVTGVTAGMTLKGWDTAVDLGEPFASTTNGNWITMTFDVLIAGMSIDGTGDWGIWINGGDYDLSGIMIDNLRFDPK